MELMQHGRGRKILLWGVVLITALVPAVSRAWAGGEHLELGRIAYHRACDYLSENFETLFAAGPQRMSREDARFRLDKLACPVKEMPCASAAEVYGRACSILGDYIEHPAELTQPEALRFIASAPRFAVVKLHDAAHFHPQAPRTYREWHMKALEAALSACKPGRSLEEPGDCSKEVRFEELQSHFESTLHTSAFADHFLQDAFSAGHMGFNRAATTASPTRLYHDAFSAHGRWVQNACGANWYAYGDTLLSCMRDPDMPLPRQVMDSSKHKCGVEVDDCDDQTRRNPDSFQGYEQVLAASTASVYEVLHTLVFGSIPPLAPAQNGGEGCGPWNAVAPAARIPVLAVSPEVVISSNKTVEVEQEQLENRPENYRNLSDLPETLRTREMVGAVYLWERPFQGGAASASHTAGINFSRFISNPSGGGVLSSGFSLLAGGLWQKGPSAFAPTAELAYLLRIGFVGHGLHTLQFSAGARIIHHPETNKVVFGSRFSLYDQLELDRFALRFQAGIGRSPLQASWGLHFGASFVFVEAQGGGPLGVSPTYLVE
jgi:hypothetical protein